MKFESQLIQASFHGKIDEIQELIKNEEVNLNEFDSKHRTALHNAVKKEHLEIIKMLIKYGAEINTKDKNNESPLETAMETSKKHTIEIVKTLVVNGAKISGNTICTAIQKNNTKILKIFVESGANINIRDSRSGYRPIHCAIDNGRLGMVQYLVKNGANLNATSNYKQTPLHAVCIDEMNRANISKTVLTKIAAFLIKNGANLDLDAQDTSGETPLHYACKHGYLDIAKLLIEKGANVNSKDQQNDSPLHLAVKYGRKNHIKILLKNGAEIDTKNNSSFTPLHEAIFRKKPNVVKLLLENNADMNIKNGKNKSAIELAKEKGFEQILEVLMKKLIEQAEAQDVLEEGPEVKRLKLDDCAVCYGPRKDIFVFTPCGHAKTCQACSIKITYMTETNSTCPVCRQKVDTYVKAFI